MLKDLFDTLFGAIPSEPEPRPITTTRRTENSVEYKTEWSHIEFKDEKPSSRYLSIEAKYEDDDLKEIVFTKCLGRYVGMYNMFSVPADKLPLFKQLLARLDEFEDASARKD